MRRVAFAALWCLVFTIPWQNAVTLAGIGTVSQAVGFASLGVGVLALPNGREFRFRAPSAFLVLMAGFVIWALASTLWSVAPRASLAKTTTLAQLLAFVWLIWEYGRSDAARAALAMAYVLGGYVAIASTVSTFLAGGLDAGWSYRVAASGFNPNWLSIGLALGIPLAWSLYLRRGAAVVQAAALAYIPLAIAAIVLAASRGGLITAFVATCVVPFTLPRLDAARRVGIVVMLVVAYLGVSTYVLDAYPGLERNLERLSSTTDEISGGSLGERTQIWSVAVRLFMAHPIVGVGFDGFRTAAEPYLDRARDPHNAYLSILVDTGLVGFVLFTGLLALAIVPAVRTGWAVGGPSVFLFAALLVGLLPANWEVHKVTWFVLAWLSGQHAVVVRTPRRYGAGRVRRPMESRVRA